MTRPSSISLPRLTVGIALFVLAGFPLVAYLWDTLNELLAGEVHPVRLLVAVPVALVFAGLLILLSRIVRGWEAERLDQMHPPAAP